MFPKPPFPLSDKTAIIGNAPGEAWLVARVWCFRITEMLLFTGTYKLSILNGRNCYTRYGEGYPPLFLYKIC